MDYSGRRSSRLSGSNPESCRMNSRTASGFRAPRIDALLLILEHPINVVSAPTPEKTLIQRIVSYIFHDCHIPDKAFGRDETHPKLFRI